MELDKVVPILPILAAAVAAALGAITFYMHARARDKVETTVKVQVGDVRIKVQGALSQQQANTIVKAITDSGALPETTSTGAIRGTSSSPEGAVR